VDSESLRRDDELERSLAGVDGILVPGGFGTRGVEGMVAAIRYAREKRIPFFGICLGLQVAVIEFARNVCGLDRANSTEFDPQTPHPVITLMDSQRQVQAMGGTMRLGGYPCVLAAGSLSRRCYGVPRIVERHRHRYEVNPHLFGRLQEKGLQASGRSPDRKLVEIVELKDHPFFVATQFHPEFQSRLASPHPIFSAFIAAALRQRLENRPPSA
ncbi:MAG TPA: gamma-glutamyl-gamma-aminobutyrate hydrolase family protein, partial [bacterium]|nr:gamma-glutamyl-gamma-aminobutyrate hydrolase family protein [bacterium]